jgi:hypothetical protein
MHIFYYIYNVWGSTIPGFFAPNAPARRELRRCRQLDGSRTTIHPRGRLNEAINLWPELAVMDVSKTLHLWFMIYIYIAYID